MNVRLFMFALILCLIFLLTGPRDTYGYLWPKQNTYMTRWDKVNLNEILDSKRLLQYYFNCLMSKGPCPPDGMELKRALPEALANACAKCTKSQIEGSVKVIRYLREFEPNKFEILANKYDPKGIYRQKYFEPPPDNNAA
ncbi:allergen Tha p 1-like [Leptopilina heterotoma]|uniref:allergen Tha p 1-like n=1 Tax=Leptopilina heterotoma TaxID=63436 RepID=UPI001CA9D59C|nr:allergen Tha p 1-like [Leptopilina heterotoma]